MRRIKMVPQSRLIVLGTISSQELRLELDQRIKDLDYDNERIKTKLELNPPKKVIVVMNNSDKLEFNFNNKVKTKDVSHKLGIKSGKVHRIYANNEVKEDIVVFAEVEEYYNEVVTSQDQVNQLLKDIRSGFFTHEGNTYNSNYVFSYKVEDIKPEN